MYKIVWSIIFLALFLLPNNTSAAKLSIGSPCDSNDQCQSNDCENSTKLDPQGKKLSFCDCGQADTSLINPSDSQDCAEAYGGAYDDWTCADGSNLTWDLDYCKNNSDIHKTQFPIPPDKGAASFIDMLLDSSAVTAQMYKEIDNIVQKPQTKITIPGLNFSEPKTIEEPTGKYLYIPFLGEYFAALYKYLIIAAGIIAVAMITNAGFGWVMSAGDSQKITHAKTRIGQALMGLFIAVASYFVLNMINPELVEFRNLRVQFVDTIIMSGEPHDDPTPEVEKMVTEKVSCVTGKPSKPYTYATGDKTYFGLWECELTRNRELKSVKVIIIHEGTASVASTIGAWKNAYKKKGIPVGAHYIIDRDGKIYQIIGEERIAYHANSANKASIGIDLIIPSGCKQNPSSPVFKTCANYTDAQYSALKSLISNISDRTSVQLNDEQVIGHCQAKTATHSDPRGFDWTKIGLITSKHFTSADYPVSGKCVKSVTY